MFHILAASDVSVKTSLYEGIPRALMESMALDCRVATDVPDPLIDTGQQDRSTG
jgi:hypothetical protein